MPDDDKNVHFRERFNACLTTWQSQVQSYCQRTSYFAVFELAAIAGAWKVIESGHWFIAALACGAGLFLTRIWYKSNLRSWQYVTYWWNMAAAIELSWQLGSESQLVARYEDRRVPKGTDGEYHDWIQMIPKLFAVIWAFLGLLAIALNWLYLHPCPSADILKSFQVH